MKDQTPWVVIGAMIAVASSLCVFCWFALADAKAAAGDGTRSVRAMEGLAEEVKKLRELENTAFLVGEQPTESTQSWIGYGKQVGIAEQQLANIQRLPPKAIEKTNYSREDVIVRLDSVLASDVVNFLMQCSNASTGYSPTSVYLRAKQGNSGDPERWTADLILTRLLYTATNQQAK